ncbi:unnamed protein product [Caenorhabditis angaria]|uniref:Neurotransmitter-gated ion-channel ligand-binding domain-containing protein n=1 Tax=Caenorhabditis angaria TaxID=860376 RepID=A0A9P1IN39_9PELO|nr:unnamed protein product [Caenorhabditis angaria]
MWLLVLFFLKVSCQLNSNGTESESYLTPSEDFTKKLFENYDNEVAPFCNDKSGIERQAWILILKFIRFKLIDVDEPKEQVTTVVEVKQNWFDQRISWDPEENDNITQLFIRLDKVWSPPFTAFSASEVVEQRDQDYRMASIHSYGSVTAHIPVKLTINCKFNMSNYPFDTQICEIITGIPSIPTHLHKLSVDFSPALSDNLCNLGNSAWDVIDIRSGLVNIKNSYEFVDSTRIGILKFQLKRNPTFYMYMIVLPIFIINALSFSGVFLKNTTKVDRLTIGLTHIMTMTFILGIIADKLPKTNSVPLLGKYIIFGLCTMIIAMLISTYLKKITEYLAGKLGNTQNSIGKHIRRFIGRPSRIIFIFAFQIANIASIIYLLYRYYDFETRFKLPESCQVRSKTMEFTHDEEDCGCF